MLEFLIQFLKDPKSIGAVSPSGKFLARKMIEPIHFEWADCIVEFGPGTGVFTKEIVKKKRKETILILIEQNKTFCQRLKNKYRNYQNVYIIHGSAENVEKYLKKYGFKTADYIVSGLPFTSLPKELSKKIFESAQRAIGSKGVFITFQYSLVKKKLFEQYFKIVGGLFEFRNIPPAYVLIMKTYKSKERI